MPSRKKLNSDEKNLIRRYLVWCYKTTKESVDRVDRKYTQLMADDFILSQLEHTQKNDKETLANHIKEFEGYILKKKKAFSKEKYKSEKDKKLNSDYLYLQVRLAAIEKAVCKFLSKAELGAIKSLYEEEMTKRILETREHS